MDLVERLRSRAYEHRHHRKYREEAAQEIDALRAEVARLKLAAGEGPQNIRFYRNGKRVESLFGPEIGLPVTTTAPPAR